MNHHIRTITITALTAAAILAAPAAALADDAPVADCETVDYQGAPLEMCPEQEPDPTNCYTGDYQGAPIEICMPTGWTPDPTWTYQGAPIVMHVSKDYVPAAAAVIDLASIAAAPSPAADVDVVTGCLYGGPSWMATWTISSSYRFSTVPAGIESGDTTTHQWDQSSTTLEVIVNVGTSNTPEYEVVTVTAEKPADCDTTPTSTSATTIPVAVAPPPIPPASRQCPTGQSFVLDTCVSNPTTTSATTIPATPPAPIPAGCAPGEYPQGPTGFEECGPVDLCSDDGQTRNWSFAPCASAVPASTPGAQLPATGLVEVWMAGAALIVIALGCLLRLVASTRRYRAVRGTP